MVDGWEAADCSSVSRGQALPLPAPEDRLCFVRTSLKTSSLRVVQGRLFGSVQGEANPWMPILLAALLAAQRALGDAPTRSPTALAQRRGVSAVDEVSAPVVPGPAASPASPLCP